MYPGFYGHTYKTGEKGGNGSGQVGRDPIGELWRPYMKTRQTQLFRELLEGAIKADSPLLSVITWNDTTEATQLLPDSNYSFAWGVLLNYYKNIWLGHPERNDREIAIVAYKKHRVEQPPVTDVALHAMNEKDYGPLADESQAEVLTILKAPAEVWVNGVARGNAGPGLVATVLPFAPGPIRVQIKREGQDVLTLAPSEWATATPRRTDPVSVLLSTECDRYCRAIFGPGVEPYRLREYVP